MIIIITGKPRVGKTALNTYFLQRSLKAVGRLRLKRCREVIRSFNTGRKNDLTAPDKIPMYTNYEVQCNAGYQTFYAPYWVNPFYLGFPNNRMQTQYILPYGELHITEGQKYWDSRESMTLPEHVSRWFEMHGHYGLDIFIDVQRGKLIDLNIRGLAKFIDVQKMIHERDVYGRILSTTWICREFANSQDYDTYSDGGNVRYNLTHYTFRGNIFRIYNSRSCRADYIPPSFNDFSLLEYKNESDLIPLPESEKIFYLRDMPDGFRIKTKKNSN